MRRFRSQMLKLSNALVSYQENCFEKHSTLLTQRQPFIKQFTQEICSKKSSFLPVGSMMTKLTANDNSDIDLAFISNKQNFRKDFFHHEEFKIYFIDHVVGMITRLGEIHTQFELLEPVTPIYHTKVPIIIAKFKNGLSLDIQFPRDNMQSIRNTHLIKSYVEADKRFPQLYFWVRALFTAMGLRNSKDGLFSSYHIILMVVHFLQQKTSGSNSVLPVLVDTYPELFGIEAPMNVVVRNLYGSKKAILPEEWRSENKKEVGELVFDFVDYYANYFSPFRDQIIIASGLAQEKKIILSAESTARLEIYDPYMSGSVCRSDILPVVLSDSFSYFWTEMSKNGRLLTSFPDFREESANFRQHFAEYQWGMLLRMEDIVESSPDKQSKKDINAMDSLC